MSKCFAINSSNFNTFFCYRYTIRTIITMTTIIITAAAAAAATASRVSAGCNMFFTDSNFNHFFFQLHTNLGYEDTSTRINKALKATLYVLRTSRIKRGFAIENSLQEIRNSQSRFSVFLNNWAKFLTMLFFFFVFVFCFLCFLDGTNDGLA